MPVILSGIAATIKGPYRLKRVQINETIYYCIIWYVLNVFMLMANYYNERPGGDGDYGVTKHFSPQHLQAKQIITKDKRIIAEFQHAERNYRRSLYYT